LRLCYYLETHLTPRLAPSSPQNPVGILLLPLTKTLLFLVDVLFLPTLIRHKTNILVNPDVFNPIMFPLEFLNAIYESLLFILWTLVSVWDYGFLWESTDLNQFNPEVTRVGKFHRQSILKPFPWPQDEIYKQFLVTGIFSGNMVKLPPMNSKDSTDDIKQWTVIDLRGTQSLMEVGELEEVTFVLTFKWKDQGWGGTKGHLFLQEEESPKIEWVSISDKFAPKDKENTEMRLSTTEPNVLRALHKKRLVLGYRVGGGGGHELYVWNVVLTVEVKRGVAPPLVPFWSEEMREPEQVVMAKPSAPVMQVAKPSAPMMVEAALVPGSFDDKSKMSNIV
jgi:hypothetical protein